MEFTINDELPGLIKDTSATAKDTKIAVTENGVATFILSRGYFLVRVSEVRKQLLMKKGDVLEARFSNMLRNLRAEEFIAYLDHPGPLVVNVNGTDRYLVVVQPVEHVPQGQ